MRNVYSISQFETIHNETHFILSEKKQLSHVQAIGQVLADSDNEAFLYIIEENDTYSYISFGQELWPQFMQMILAEQKAFLQLEDGALELVGLVEELKMLLYNIEGNSNYGEKFVQAVEETFAQLFVQN